IAAISAINEAIDTGDSANTIHTLSLDEAKLSGVDESNAVLYQAVLHAGKVAKAEKTGEDSAELWHGEIQTCLDQSNKHAGDTHQLVEGLVAINHSIDNGDEEELLSALGDPAASIRSVTPDCANAYVKSLQKAKKAKKDAGIQFLQSQLVEVLFNCHHQNFHSVECPQYSLREPERLSTDILSSRKPYCGPLVDRVTGDYDHMVYLQSNEPMIVKLQSHWKGYLARRAYKDRQTFIKEQLPAILRIQANIRGFLQRVKYRRRLAELKSSENDVIKIQSWMRMCLARKKYLQREKYFKEHQAAIIKIQAWVRANVAHNDYKKLITMQDPPVKTVRKFLHLLQHSDADFEEELELQKLRAQVVTDIRSNQQLENDLNLMDIKIGLLVKNRITLQVSYAL
ncbi:predicted protein, partial [Nematostella vectensis]